MTFPHPQTLSMRTRDGTRLDADVYFPAGAGHHPVLLMRQPYGRRIASTVTYAHPAWYCAQGYIVAIQDVRGRGTSEGEFDPLFREAEDGRDTLDWAAQLPGADGQIGMYGFSYQGATQLLAAATRHPALKTLCPAMCAWDLYEDWAYEGAAPRLALNLGWAAQIAAETSRRAATNERALRNERNTWHQRYAQQLAAAQSPGAALLIDACGPQARDLLAGSHYESWLDEPRGAPYWTARSPATFAPAEPLPALHIGGWFDFFLTGTLAAYEHYRLRNPRQKLIIGPWTHLPWTRHLGGALLPGNAHSRIDELQVRWFDHILKGKANGIEREAAVELYDLAERKWQRLAEYPRVPPTPLHLGSDGRAAFDPAAGRLEPQPQSHAADLIVHDPWRPVPTHGGHLPPSMGMVERSETDARNDVATYTTAPLDMPWHLMGPVHCTLQAEADLPSFDIAAVLSVVSREGRVHNLTQGYLRCNTPGEQRIALRHVCARIEPGESLRLSISGASYPGYGLNPGKPGVPGTARAADFPIITLRISGPSTLELPRVRPAQLAQMAAES